MVTATGPLPPGAATDLVAGGVRKLRGLVEDVLEAARLEARAACVETDPRRVERILANLVTNALRHGTPPVTVEADRYADGPLVRVRDHGPGFPTDLLAVVTASGPEGFRTGEASTGKRLGLTIAFGQAQSLGARLILPTIPTEERMPPCGSSRPTSRTVMPGDTRTAPSGSKPPAGQGDCPAGGGLCLIRPLPLAQLLRVTASRSVAMRTSRWRHWCWRSGQCGR
ncbi:sensor histidine kinase [Streptomyces turgidiscabies]|nr:sensor protein CseC [Streptomyces turgidiscabies]